MNELSQALRNKIRTGDVSVAVLGQGSVGVPLALAFARRGIPVLGFDIDPERVARLNRGEAYLHHLGPGVAAELARSDCFEASSEPSALEGVDAKIICVPTPLGEFREPDLSHVEAAARLAAAHARPGELIVLESTTYPGTTRDVVAPIVRACGFEPGVDLFLAYSPEREDPGRTDHDTTTIPKLVGGFDDVSGELAEALYARAVERVLRVSNTEVAESAKLLENIFRAVNIALVNELKVVLDAMKIDVWEVIEAASSKPFGYMKFTPGPGMGGHCIPVDPFYLTWVARKVGLSTKFIELAGEINRRMPRYVVERTQLALNARGKAVKDADVLVLGLAYKPDVGIVDESPSIELIRLFGELGARVRYADPHVEVPAAGFRGALAGQTPLELSESVVRSFDVVVVSTHHAAFDWDLIARSAQLVVDTRNALADRMAGSANYVKA